MNFIRRKPATDIPNMSTKTKGASTSFIAFFSFLILVLFIFASYTGFMLFSVYQQIRANWQEIVFAYEKPSIVKVIRQDYQIKMSQVDSSYSVKSQTPEQKLLNAVSDKLQQSK